MARVVLELDSFSVSRDAQLAIVGHNGSGKSTLLRILALLERPTEGEVLPRGTQRAELNRIVDEVAAWLSITTLLGRASHELSEGDVQRVAVARALAEGRLSPATPKNLFRVDLHQAASGDLKHVPVGRSRSQS